MHLLTNVLASLVIFALVLTANANSESETFTIDWPACSVATGTNDTLGENHFGNRTKTRSPLHKKQITLG